jgi:hypothetical protein
MMQNVFFKPIVIGDLATSNDAYETHCSDHDEGLHKKGKGKDSTQLRDPDTKYPYKTIR